MVSGIGHFSDRKMTVEAIIVVEISSEIKDALRKLPLQKAKDVPPASQPPPQQL
ncbi:TPA: hypothetical protein HA317_00050 [Candidatus Woesearchaeota archaeon]|nr:hypothetical protein [Candidatus Woesearchaeota archaeon]